MACHILWVAPQPIPLPAVNAEYGLQISVDPVNDQSILAQGADQERARNEAESYANDILPMARGEASRITQEADA